MRFRVAARNDKQRSVPQWALFFVVILNSGAKRNVIQNPLHWDN